MSSCGIFIIWIMVQLFCYHTDALRHGSEPSWIANMMCVDKIGIIPIPWNCEGYFYCTNIQPKPSGVWLECIDGQKFDRNLNRCVRFPVNCPPPNYVANQLCPTNPGLKFPHPASCAMYYDCSQTNVLRHFNLGLHENECDFPQMFDDELGKCRYDQPYPVICSNKPTSKADYRKERIYTSPECAGKMDGSYPPPTLPPFSPHYSECRNGFKSASRQCSKGFVFDPVTRQCSSNFTASLIRYCSVNRLAVFPDPLHCARYYNCSLPKLDGFNPHQRECKYMYLFDGVTRTCKLYKHAAPCGSRFEPFNPCDYRVGHCVDRDPCLPCEAKCKGKVDGPHPYPTLPNTRYHMMCAGGRTQEVLSCLEGQIYSHDRKLCVRKVPSTTPKPTTPQPTTPKPTIPPRPTSPPVPPPPSGPEVCTCLDEINSVKTGLRNLSSTVDAMHSEMQVGHPYDCDEPPKLAHSVMRMSYEFDMAVARYTCVEGYAPCVDEVKSTCTGQNRWDRSSLRDCLKNTWTSMNDVMLPCQLNFNSAVQFKGRSVEDMFTFSLINKISGNSYLSVKVRPTLGTLEAGGSTVTSRIPLTGETTWTIEFHPKSFEIYINGQHIMSVPNSSDLSLITNLLLSDDLHTGEVKYFHTGNPSADYGKHPLNVNLALNKKTFASSEYELAKSSRANDGYSHVLLRENSCWSAEGTDPKPWWMVDLGKIFYVSYVVITSLDCQGQCGRSLMNFKIEILEEDIRQNMFATRKTCYTYDRTFPSRSVERIDCSSDIIGRYVIIAAEWPFTGQMTLCEVEVYGGLKKKTGWSPFSCPDPPVIEGASVQLSYTDFEAMATYTCDGSSVMCTGNSVIHCSNETGWDASPGTCTKTSLDAGIGGSLPDFPICRLNLGSGVELWVRVTENIGNLDLTHDQDTILRISLTLHNIANPVSLKHIMSGVSSAVVYPPQNPFEKGKESHITIRALTDYLLIEVDGEIFYKYPVDQLNVHKAVFLESSNGLKIRKAKIYPGFIYDVLREPVEHNLALNADVESSSSYANPETYAVDGNPSQVWPSGSCWNADIGDTNQWYQVDLGKQFFIRDINIYLRSISNQKNYNLALKKETFGSPDYDSYSSPDNVVDDNHNDRRYSGSCFSTHTSAKDPWWMVDLGKHHFISSVAIQVRGDSGYASQSSDLAVTIYDSNPRTDPDSQGTLCTKRVGPWGSFERVPCSSPVRGRFVVVKRSEGATQGILTICEVQVFENYEIDNLAFKKETFGSPNLDSRSSQDNVVDGNHNDQRVSGSCYTSSLSESDPWWMVDLGNTFTISSVAIQHRGDGYPEHHSDLAVTIYESNPKTTANVPPKPCTKKAGPWGAFVKVPCTRPVIGRFVMIKRMEGSNPGVMTICEVQVFEAIESKLHDFTVNVYEENPVLVDDAISRRCIRHRGDFPKNELTTLSCAEDVWGRYVRIKADNVRDQYDQMTICEVEVYGDKAVKKMWSPMDCPAPPLLSNAFVSVVYTPTKAEASYECFDGFATCNGRNTIACTSEEGWSGIPEGCLPRRFSAYDPDGLEVVHFCPLRLGEAIELFVMPASANMVLVLSAGLDEVLHMTWLTTPRRELLIKTDLTSVEPFPPVLVEPVPFAVSKESKVVITVLSYALHVDIDGEIFYVKVKSPHLIDTVRTNKGIMGKLSILDAGDIKTMLVPSLDNLAESRPASATSEWMDIAHAERVVDGDLSMSWNSNSCWSSTVGDFDVWWMVDLESLYYVSRVTITTRGSCGSDCNRRTHDFKIEVFHRQPEPQDIGDLCLQYDGILQFGTTTTLKCRENVFGRLLRISAPDRRNKNDLFTLCEVQVYGGLVVKEDDGSRNLALFRPAAASSLADNVALPGRAVDGNKNFKYISGSCWLAATTDSNPWWQVELDNYYYVTHVEISSRIKCQPIDSCPKSVRDFEIEVFPRDPTLGLQSHSCLQYDGVFPHSTTKMLKCTNKALGRFVRISSPNNNIFTLCEFGVFGEEIAFGEITWSNLALDRPVSSSSRTSPPQWAVDGNHNMDWAENSCWSAEDGESTSWLMVELDDYYLVSRVGITSRDNCGIECNKRVRNFKIEVFYEEPVPGDKGELCHMHKDIFPHGQSKVLQCTEKALGRFVRLTAEDRKLTMDRLTICEFGVFGAKVKRTGWTPSDCPEPPLLPNACVDISYKADQAVATYTCNTNYSMCTGSNMLHCNGKDGWEGTPGKCLQTTLEVHHGHVTDLSEFPVCYLGLGEGLELWLTPLTSGCTLELLTSQIQGTALKITITPDDADHPVTLTTVNGATVTDYKVFRKNFFALKKESHVVVLFLSRGILVKVDGKMLPLRAHITSSAKINYIRTSDLTVRLVRPVDRYMEGIVRTPSEDNLALDAMVSVPSGTNEQVLVDGDRSQAFRNCWLPATGEKNQWLILDLTQYVFIREVILYNREVDECTTCDRRTRDFVINVSPIKNDDDMMTTCAVYKGVLPLGAIEKIRCQDNVWGRYVKIISAKEITDGSDLMTFCEIEIYGDEIIQKKWTIFDCPKPILLPHASVQLSYTDDSAVAIYTCETHYSMCTGSNMLRCTSEVGWRGDLGTCRRTTLERDYGRNNDLRQFPICSPKLGEGLEMWIFPETSGSKLSLKTGISGNTVLALTITPSDVNKRAAVVGGVSSTEVAVTNDLFQLETEALVHIVFLLDKLTILVDGMFLASYPHEDETPLISYVESTANMNIRKFRPLSRYLDGIVRIPLDTNLALQKTVIAVSNIERRGTLVDGDLTQNGVQCWHAAIGESNQWVTIDLGDYYFIRELVLYNRNPDCGVDCAKRTHDFAIDILPNEQVDEMTARCAFYSGIMPASAVEKIRCEDDVWGRYVRISATEIRGPRDLMTFCEVEVYGDAVVDEKYQVCPKLGPVDHGQVTYTGMKVMDVATLKCDANAKPCGSKLTSVCQENTTWEALTTCNQFLWVSQMPPFVAPIPCGFPSAFLIIMEITPLREYRCTIDLSVGSDILLHWSIRFKYAQDVDKSSVNTRISGNWSPPKTLSTFPFAVHQKATVVINYRGVEGKYYLAVDDNLVETFTEKKPGAVPENIEFYGGCSLDRLEVGSGE